MKYHICLLCAKDTGLLASIKCLTEIDVEVIFDNKEIVTCTKFVFVLLIINIREISHQSWKATLLTGQKLNFNVLQNSVSL